MSACIAYLIAGILLLFSSDLFAAAPMGSTWDEDELAILVPIIFVVALFTFLILRLYFDSRVQRAAIEHGQLIPQRQPTDPRKAALILIALGLGYSIAVYVTLIANEPEQALTASVWGIVPLLIGAGLWIYYRIFEKERDAQEDNIGVVAATESTQEGGDSISR